jgi:hypothetical protein
MMNEVSIIINGVRYDAVSTLPNPTLPNSAYPICSQCHFDEACESIGGFCNSFLEPEQVFKKSTKSFEP